MNAPAAPVLVIMGVSGSGKSTVAGALQQRLGWDSAEGDDMHPAANVAKMRAGEPLTDDDRWPWLATVAEWIDHHIAEGRPGIITCSALKRIYRDVLRRDAVVFVHLVGSSDEIARRMATRPGHFMPAALLGSQLATLEPPEADENVLVVDVVDHSTAQVTEWIVDRLGAGSPLSSQHPA